MIKRKQVKSNKHIGSSFGEYIDDEVMQCVMRSFDAIDNEFDTLIHAAFERSEPLTDDELGNLLIGMQALSRSRREKLVYQIETAREKSPGPSIDKYSSIEGMVQQADNRKLV